MHAQGFLLTYNREEPPLTEADYDGFAAWIEGPFTEKHKLWRVSHTFERCPETNNMHIHAFIEFKTRIDWPTTDNVVWMNVRPNVQANWNSLEEGLNSRARGFVRLSLDGGHYYTFVDKIGSIRSGGNYRPFKHYAPRPEKTIDRWWSQGKISDDVYERESAKFGVGADRRLRDVAAKRSFMKMTAGDSQIAQYPPIPDEDMPIQVVHWKQQLCVQQDRFVALVMYGPSRTGKTCLGRQFGPHLYFRSSINWQLWQDTSRESRSYVVFDDVDWQSYTRDQHKAIMSGQATFDMCSSHAFMRTISHGVPVVILLNDETPAEQEVIKSWMEDPWKQQNVVFVRIAARLYKARRTT